MQWNAVESYRGGWIRPESFSIHRKSATHMHSLELKAAAAEREQAETAHILNPPRESATLNILLIPAAEVELHDTDSQSYGISQEEQHFWDALDPTSEVFEMDESPEVALERKRQEFERKLDEYGVWEGHEDIMDDDAAAALELAWDESEQDEVLSEVLKNLGKIVRTLTGKLSNSPCTLRSRHS